MEYTRPIRWPGSMETEARWRGASPNPGAARERTWQPFALAAIATRPARRLRKVDSNPFHFPHSPLVVYSHIKPPVCGRHCRVLTHGMSNEIERHPTRVHFLPLHTAAADVRSLQSDYRRLHCSAPQARPQGSRIPRERDAVRCPTFLSASARSIRG